jgi:predicted AlkP superfamily phosphohydrolase/phosphomutase
MSDHGFETWRRKFSLNTWLLEQGYLVLREGREREEPKGTPGRVPVLLQDAVDWSRTRAYGVGFNGLYLNLRGREKDDPGTRDVDEAGIVDPSAAEALLREIAAKLEALRDADGTRVVLRAALAKEIYDGRRLAEAPDIVVGYNAGYGNSDASSTGRIPNLVLDDNDGGTFNGNHLMDPSVVPGILLANRPVPAGEHRLEDLTVEILRQYGVTPGEGVNGRPVFQ